MMDVNNLNDLRLEIDSIDSQLIMWLNRRFDICKQIGIVKQNQGIKQVQDPAREEAIINRLTEQEAHKDMVKTLWPHIMAYSRSLQ